MSLLTRETELAVLIDGLNCASCVGCAQRALAAVPGVRQADVNLASERATLRFADAVDAIAVKDALDKAGYPARTDSVVMEVGNMSCAS